MSIDTSFPHAIELLREEFLKKSGEYFGELVVEKAMENDDAALMLKEMFNSAKTDDMPDEINEILLAIRVLQKYSEARKKEKEPTDETV